jgi:hypothetical protein
VVLHQVLDNRFGTLGGVPLSSGDFIGQLPHTRVDFGRQL